VAGGAEASNPSSQGEFAVARYNPNGTLDTTFGSGGLALTDVSKLFGLSNYSSTTESVAIEPSGPIIAGKYVTNAGAEVIKSDGDVNYSRSILFGYAIPFTHTGVRATYKVNDALTVLGGVNEGWDAFESPSHDATVELGGTFAPTKTVSITASYYGGKELVTNYPKSSAKGTRNLFDIVGTFNATDQLTFVLNYDYGTQQNAAAGGGRAKWDGIAGYANYQINDQWRLVLRGEYFDGPDDVVHVRAFGIEYRAVGNVALEMRRRLGNGPHSRRCELRRRGLVQQCAKVALVSVT